MPAMKRAPGPRRSVYVASQHQGEAVRRISAMPGHCRWSSAQDFPRNWLISDTQICGNGAAALQHAALLKSAVTPNLSSKATKGECKGPKRSSGIMARPG